MTRDAYLDVIERHRPASSRPTRTRAGRSSTPTSARRSRYSTPAFALAGAALLLGRRRETVPLAGRRARDGVRLRVARRREGGRRPRRLLHRPAACMPTACSRRRCRTRRRRPGAAISRASCPRRSTGDSRPRRRSTTGTSWPWPASGCARRPGSGTRCRGSRRRSIASWSCSRRGACTATPTTRWPTTTSRGCGRSICWMRATGAATPPRLETLVERGAWTSLFMQSPWGELPCGGRSAHHQWNEAQQAVTFESWASRFATPRRSGGGRRLQAGRAPVAAVDRALGPAVGRALDRQEPHGPGRAPWVRVLLVPLAVQPAGRGHARHRLVARRRPHPRGAVPGRHRRLRVRHPAGVPQS